MRHKEGKETPSMHGLHPTMVSLTSKVSHEVLNQTHQMSAHENTVDIARNASITLEICGYVCRT